MELLAPFFIRKGETMEIKMLGLNEITPYENNPRKNADAVDKVASSIREFGFQSPIIVDKNLVIVAGHTRYEAAKKLNLKAVPVIVAENLTDEQAKAYRLADNKTAEFAEWDNNLLDKELFEIEDIDMSQFGFDKLEVDMADFGDEFSLPDGEEHTRTITLSLNEKQYQIAQAVEDYVNDNDLTEHDFGNPNKNSNAIFEAIYQWAAQKNLL